MIWRIFKAWRPQKSLRPPGAAARSSRFGERFPENRLHRFWLVLLTIFLAGCSLRFNEEVTKPKISVNPVQSGCLSNSAPLLEKYFDGKADSAEVEGYWLCLEKAFVTFTEHTRGASRDHFTGEELASFLTKYFLKGKVVPPALVQEAMQLKQGLIGGAANRITRDELRQTLELVRTLRRVSLDLRPHMPFRVSNFTEKKYGPTEVEAAVSLFESGLEEIGKTISTAPGSYSFDRLSSLLREFKMFLYPEDAGVKVRWLDTAITLTTALRPAKALFVSPPKDEIRSEDWAKIYHIGPRYYGIYLRAHFLAKTDLRELMKPEGIARVEDLQARAVKLLGTVIDNHPNGVIESREVDDFLDALKANDMLSPGVETTKAFIRTLFGRVLSTSSASGEYTITKATLERAGENFRFATEGLRAIEFAYRSTGKRELKARDFSNIATETLVEATALKNDISREAVLAIKTNSSDVRTIFPNEANVVYVPAGAPLERLSPMHLAKTHLLYTLNRLLSQAYGARKESLTAAEVGVLADDVFPMLLSFNLVAPETRTSVEKRLFEASLFLYSSDGDPGLQMSEAIELQSLLVSTIVRGRDLHKFIAERCQSQKFDERGRVLIAPACYRKEFLDMMKPFSRAENKRPEVWNYIPGLAKFAADKIPADRKKILTLLESFLRKGRLDDDFNPSDSYSLILLPYYVELLYSRFDANHDGLLSNQEAAKAFPVFRPFIKTKAEAFGYKEEKDFVDIFLFLLAYQDLPNNNKGTWMWRRTWGAADFKIDRGQVIQIFEKLLSK